MKVLVVDNYDSFVYTLNGYLNEIGAETTVVRNDSFPANEAEQVISAYDAVLVSPGPGTPAAAGVSIPVIRAAHELQLPMLGVCLGHQALAEAFGATVSHAEELMHGKTSLVQHLGDPLFQEVPNPFTATRYHSLAVVSHTVPDALEVTAQTEGGVIMGLRHRSAPLVGVQFHPESVLTEGGYRMLGNWLESAGLAGARERSRSLNPLMAS
ncbi:MAG TPA: gamma-glutamyl-gamma-aminobutyrate hydrolase family protein [Microbacteriaceae bacterium]|nr:gamma-glutamyl-gamma-aminobutyrate hydrolase family protein [Microbacteriaceae bacterium]